MRRLLFAVLSLIPAGLFGQNTITGVVIDSKTREPLPFATVYINGTTKGTATDTDGSFELKDVSFPATVVFSFVGYKPQAHDLNRVPNKMAVALETNDELPEVVINGKVKRSDLNYFKRMFLGDDRWGRNATIKNEHAIMIYNSESTKQVWVDTDTRKVKENNDGARVAEAEEVKTYFKAWAYEPILIDLPLLGYELYVDLVQFTVEKTGSRIYTAGGPLDINNRTQCNMLGYFYYKPYENLKKRQAESIAENRRQAYYNSSQHFLRSFYENRLKENGYTLSKEKLVKTKTERNNVIKTINFPVDIEKHSAFVGENMMQVYGLKDSLLSIRYYHQRDGSPVNLNENETTLSSYSESGIAFMKDTCVSFKNGIVIDNNIRFMGEISEKRVGACLPDDYNVDDD